MKKTTLFNLVGIALMSVVISVACSVKDDSTDPSDPNTNISLYKGTATFGTNQSTIYTGIMISNNSLYEMDYIEPYSLESFKIFNYSNNIDKALMYEKLNAISNINWSVSDVVNIGARQ